MDVLIAPPPIRQAPERPKQPRLRWLAPLVAAIATAAVVSGVNAAVIGGATFPPEPPEQRLELRLSYIEADDTLIAPGTEFEGQLLVRRHCLFLQTAAGPVDLSWPAGYSAERESGDAVVRDADDGEIAQAGDWVRVAGARRAEESAFGCGVGDTALAVSSVTDAFVEPDGWPSHDDFDLADHFDQFAAYPNPGLVTFGATVHIGVGGTLTDRLDLEEVLDRDAWWQQVQHAHGTGGHVSPLSRVVMLQGNYLLSTTARTCSGSADVRVPEALTHYRVLSYEPPAGTPCRHWSAVDVYLDEHDRIAGVIVRL